MTLAQTIVVSLAVVACCTGAMFAVLGVAWKLAQRSARREIAARHAREKADAMLAKESRDAAHT